MARDVQYEKKSGPKILSIVGLTAVVATSLNCNSHRKVESKVYSCTKEIIQKSDLEKFCHQFLITLWYRKSHHSLLSIKLVGN